MIYRCIFNVSHVNFTCNKTKIIIIINEEKYIYLYKPINFNSKYISLGSNTHTYIYRKRNIIQV